MFLKSLVKYLGTNILSHLDFDKNRKLRHIEGIKSFLGILKVGDNISKSTGKKILWKM